MYNKGAIVVRLSNNNYNLAKTSEILRLHFSGQSHASTSYSHGDAMVEWADEHGALVSYEQQGYLGRGWLYYSNQYLELARRPEEVINDYTIY